MVHQWVRDHLPLKQGLRLESSFDDLFVCTRPSSIKTRIKTLSEIAVDDLRGQYETIFH